MINAGILSVSSDANLGNASGGITLAGGQLLAGGNISSARSVTVNGTGSSMRVAKNNNITTSGALNGAGALTLWITAVPAPTLSTISPHPAAPLPEP